MGAARQAIRHLKDGGALLVFARSTMDPDPAFMPGAENELNNWTSSLGLFLRSVPQTRIVIGLISGVLSPKYLNHPSTLIRKGRVNKQRLSEFYQVMYQLMRPKKLMVSPDLSFGPAFSLKDLGGGRDIHLLTNKIIQKAQQQFEVHRSRYLEAA